MVFRLPPLPYAMNALEPHLSALTLSYHYGRHHKSYVDALNKLVAQDSRLAGRPLVDLIQTSSGPVFQNAAQSWNHAFYWKSMSPQGGGAPRGALGRQISEDFGSLQAFKKAFSKAAMARFGSGWAWLVLTPESRLQICTTSNADTPLARGRDIPLLVMDVWEHAYYLDHQNERAKYVQAFWEVVNWRFAEENLENWDFVEDNDLGV